ncbi:MAG TPA: hypothetical protein DCE71_07855 [Parachlamydiales bacterium]|nr:hypothetical protein [Parachlamydiales bacterium]
MKDIIALTNRFLVELCKLFIFVSLGLLLIILMYSLCVSEFHIVLKLFGVAIFIYCFALWTTVVRIFGGEP